MKFNNWKRVNERMYYAGNDNINARIIKHRYRLSYGGQYKTFGFGVAVDFKISDVSSIRFEDGMWNGNLKQLIPTLKLAKQRAEQIANKLNKLEI